MNSLDQLSVPSRAEDRVAALRNLLSLPEEIAIFYAFGAPQDGARDSVGPRSSVLLYDEQVAPWWEAYCSDRGRHWIDPVRYELRRSTAPVLWNTLAPGGRIEATGEDIWAQVRDHDIRAGLSIPLRDPQRRQHGALAFIGFCAPALFDEWWHDMAPSVVGAAHLFHHGLMESTGGVVAGRLSPRERQCLTRVAAGMNSKAIARDLGLAPRTVDLHVARAARRLGARTRMEAVARAVRLGEVDVGA